MKKERLSERDLKAVLGLIMLLVAALAYFIGFKVFLSSAAVTKLENADLEVRLNELKEKDRNKQATIKQTEEYNKKIQDIVMNYPSKVTPEKVFYDMYNLDKALGKTSYTSVVAEMNGLFYPEGNSDTTQEDQSNAEQPSEEAQESVKQGFTSDGVVTVYKTQVTTQVKNLSYQSLKDMVKNVNEYDGRMTMDSLNLTFSKESGLLEGTIVYELYALEGSPKEYVVPDIRMDSGVKNIFGTFDAK